MYNDDQYEEINQLQEFKIGTLEDKIYRQDKKAKEDLKEYNRVFSSCSLDSLRVKALEKLLRDNNIPFDNLVYNVKKDEVDVNE